ncbi:hypothetical protein BS78_07G221200 [Paspalum vaginatum]|nr:hypothetical protein BS78_07G221200 [Paspalum vaginatum]
MEPAERGEDEEERHQLAWEAAGTCGGGGSDSAAACCVCPAAVTSAAAAPPPPFVLPRHALEQELLRRAEMQQQGGGGGGGDRRRERKMKNRESAARSRARRHAYVSELEKEVELLRAENAELRRLYDELKTKAAEVLVPVPMKRPQAVCHSHPHQELLLQRTSSAPM